MTYIPVKPIPIRDRAPGRPSAAGVMARREAGLRDLIARQLRADRDYLLRGLSRRAPAHDDSASQETAP